LKTLSGLDVQILNLFLLPVNILTPCLGSENGQKKEENLAIYDHCFVRADPEKCGSAARYKIKKKFCAWGTGEGVSA
jgi:hypothetical protein